VSALPDLAVPPEPLELRERTRALAARDPRRGRDRVAAGAWIAGPLWQAWGPELRRAGVDRAGLVGVARAYDRELWLWVMGERTWAQCAAGLAGRVRRRLPPRPAEAAGITGGAGRARGKARAPGA